MVGILFLLGALTLASGVELMTKPQHLVVQSGKDARFNCTPGGGLGDEELIWKEMITQKLGALIYKTDMDGPNDPEDYAIVNDYDLIVRKADLMDGGWYSCELSSDVQPSPARLVVIEAPVIQQNMVDFVEGGTYNMGCSVMFGAPTFETEDENLPVFRVSIDNRIIANHSITKVMGEVGVKPSSYSVDFNFLAQPEYDGKEVDCTVLTELPEFRLTTSHTLRILHGVNSVSVQDKNPKYRVGDTIVCSANGHPSPTYTWKSADGKEIGGDKLRVTAEMVGGTNEWTCVANNTVQGVPAEASDSISFRAEEMPINGASPMWSLSTLLGTLVTVVLAYAF